MAKLPQPKWDLGTTLYPKVCASRENAAMLTGYLVRPGLMLYLVTDEEGEETQRLGIELTDELAYGLNTGVGED